MAEQLRQTQVLEAQQAIDIDAAQISVAALEVMVAETVEVAANPEALREEYGEIVDKVDEVFRGLPKAEQINLGNTGAKKWNGLVDVNKQPHIWG